MAPLDLPAIEGEFRQAIGDCQRLYLSAAEQLAEARATDEPGSAARRLSLMDDLHKGLLIKVYGAVAQSDHRWTAEEAQLAQILLEHLWEQRLSGEELRQSTLHLFQQCGQLKWYSLVQPFAASPILRDRIDELETIVLRVANLVAKCDGVVTDGEAALLRTIEGEIALHLRPLSLADGDEEPTGESAVQTLHEIEATTAARQQPGSKQAAKKPPAPPTPALTLDQALAELSALIGLKTIKDEVATLTNFLKLQRERTKAGLPVTTLNLHMVFTGNPGTGKTSIARIVGQILRAMGILKNGHLIETDRSGLVAQYAGQTAPKTNKLIDEALDGVLFIDEAYSLVAAEGEDAYGHEAVQTLLKRMEDDRHRLVIILAGYPEPMADLLRSNPGLSSRFSLTLAFPDYRPRELGLIFQNLCDKNRYQAPGATQAKLLVGFQWLYERRDNHFGNGRLVRNVFELAIRRLGNRIAGVSPLTRELLTVIQPEDIEFTTVPADVLKRARDDAQRFLVRCPGCDGKSHIPASFLGRTVKCKSCEHRFVAAWGEPLDPTPSVQPESE